LILAIIAATWLLTGVAGISLFIYDSVAHRKDNVKIKDIPVIIVVTFLGPITLFAALNDPSVMKPKVLTDFWNFPIIKAKDKNDKTTN